MPEYRVNTTIRALTEAFVKEKMDELKDNPERGVRNLVDFALSLCESPFQQNLLTTVQTMLQDSQSSYYKLVQDIASHVNEDHLITFGMDASYNSLTFGAKLIRENEAEGGFYTPWVISLAISERTYDRMEVNYHSLIEQGMELGIYSWIFVVKSGAEKVLPLIQAHPDCAFLLITPAEEVTEDFLGIAETLDNLVVSVKYDTNALCVYTDMRKRKMLYAACVPYHPKNITEQELNDILSDLNELHPVFALLLSEAPSEDCSFSVHNDIQALRHSQRYSTVPLDLYEAIKQISGNISSEPCTLSFDETGNVCKEYSTASATAMNLCSMPLAAILKTGYKKTCPQIS